MPLTAEGLVVYDSQWTKPDYHAEGYPGLITNGAYRLVSWTFRQRARLEVNPFHRNADRVACRSVDMLEIPNVSASLMAYEAADVDFLTDMTVPYDHELARLARSGQRPDFRVCPVLATYFLNFNCANREVDGRPNPFVDPRVRRAFTLATDRRALVEEVLARGDRVARSLVPPDSIPGYAPPAGVAYDPTAARHLLEQAGYSSADFPVVEVLCTFNDERTFQALARMWSEALGVHVDIRTQESKTLAQDKADRRYMIARGNWYADYTDPTTFLNCHLTGDGNNDAGYANPEYDAMIVRAERAADQADRMRLLAEAEAILVQRDCPVLPILHYAQLLAVKPHVQGLHQNARLWFPFQYVSIQR
jgi:oligopeptide transport system substrate-binding protein